MTYCTYIDVAGLVSFFKITPTSTPTQAQVSQYCVDTANQIDSALSSLGLAVPITAPPEFLADLVLLNAMGAAGLLELSVYPQNQGTGAGGSTPTHWQSFQARLKEFRAGTGVPKTVMVAEYTDAPTSTFIFAGAIGPNSNGATDDWGDPISSEPAFSREQII